MQWHKMTVDGVFENLSSGISGLSSAEANSRISKNGKNILKQRKKQPFLKKLFLSLCDTMTVILFVASAVSFTVSKLQGESTIDSFIILGVVFINAVVSIIQESKAERSLEALKKLTSPEALVMRDGKKQSIDAELLVTGDIIYIQKGDLVPADCRIISQSGLTCDESSLTGEVLGVFKTADTLTATDGHLSSLHNMLWSGTLVTAGHGTAIVVATGMDSYVGSIAKLLTNESKSEKTPLQKRLAKTGTALGNGALIICLVIFAVSLLKGFPPAEMFLTSVSLAVAAIPEGLPATVTVMLSLGVTKMAKRRAIVRKLTAVETLGCTTVICSDKTGTLTQNKMTVTEFTGDENILSLVFSKNNDDSSPTEKALIDFAKSRGKTLDTSKRIKEIPFDSKTKFMATLHAEGSGYIATVKGAPEVVSKFVSGIPQSALTASKSMASRGLRIICAGYARLKEIPKDLEGIRYTYAGIVGISDPPRDGVYEAVNACKSAGIRAVMITGDHKDTAVAIAKEIGIFESDSVAYTQLELEKMNATERQSAMKKCCVFARTTPEFKLKIVETLKASGEVVSMTGDGVNDAPALKKADVGCAMGINGTDVSKESSDIILTDDNFSTIVSAVEFGRSIYSNIRRAVHFLLSCNIGEIITMFVAIVLSFPSPLTAVQLLWVNLVTDSLPAVALGFEKPHKGIMKEKPIKKDSGLFKSSEWFLIALEGILIGGVSVLAYYIGNKSAGPAVADTMCFGVLSLSQLFHSFGLRSKSPVIKAGIFKNPMLLLALALSASLQLAVMLIPALSSVFGVTQLPSDMWNVTLMLSFTPFLFGEIRKFITGK